jgi:hypothetical protein
MNITVEMGFDDPCLGSLGLGAVAGLTRAGAED